VFIRHAIKRYRVVNIISPLNRLNLETILISLDRKVCTCAFAFNIVSAPLDGAITQCRNLKYGKIWGIFQGRHDVPMNVKFNTEEYVMAPLAHAKIGLIGERSRYKIPKIPSFAKCGFSVFFRPVR